MAKEGTIENLTHILADFVVRLILQDALEDENEMEKTISRIPVKSENYDDFCEQCAALKRDIGKIRQLIQDGVSALPLE